MSNKFRTLVATLLLTAAVLALAGAQPAQAMEPSVPLAGPFGFGKIEPENGATGVPSTTVLSWEVSEKADSYELCIHTGRPYECDAITGNWVSMGTDTGLKVQWLPANTTYHWQVRALDWTGAKTYANNGTFWTFTTGGIPGAFSKTAPTNGTAGGGQNPTLSWTSSTSATSYEYCLSAMFPCSSWFGNGENTSYQLTGLAVNTVYYWDVRATSDWGTTYADGDTGEWHFNTGPGSFNKLAPATGSTGVALTPTLSWGTSAGASSYEYCYWSSFDVCTGSLNGWVSVGSAKSVQLSALSASTTYHWSVRAISGSGTTYADTVSWTFTTGDPPGAFNKSTPTNGSAVLSPSQILTWGASSGATSYEYCYGTTNPCSNWTSVGTSTSVSLTGLSPSTTYYWEIVAHNPFGNTYANGSNADWSFTTGGLPGAFNKSAPANGASAVALSPTLGWGASSGAASYEYCYGTTNPCSNWASAGTNTSAGLSGLIAGTAYYWHVRANNAFGSTYANGSTTDWSFTTGFKPGAFDKSGPTNGSVVLSPNQTLTWGPSSGVSTYYYCYGTTNPCGNWTSVGTSTSVALAGLSASTTYYWEVRADNVFGSTYADGTNTDWSFTTIGLGTFNKAAPANGATGVSLTPTLSWGASSGATVYYYCISSTTNPCSNWTSAGTNTSVALASLSLSTTYYWQIRADNAFGSMYANGSNTDWSFTTGGRPPAFNKSAPANGATGVALNPTLSWGSSSGATAFYYCYGTTNPCSNWASAGTNTSTSLAGLNEGTTYYWQVRADNTFGSTYANGSNTDWSFTTGSKPGPFIKSAPANGSVVLSPSPTLTWGPSSGATSYEYCYGTTNPCSDWTSVGTSTSAPLTGLLPDTTYYWEVVAHNPFGDTYANGSNADWSFTTQSLPGAFNLKTPASGAAGLPANPTLNWEASSNATLYRYCYGTTNPCTDWTSVGATTSVTLTGLLPDTIYYWEVVARNAFGDAYAGGSNTDWSFTTGSGPGAFNKTGPTDGATGVLPNMTLSWGTSENASSYSYCISTANPCANWKSAGAGTAVPLNGLKTNTKYYWEVKATNSFGDTFADGSNTDWSFTTLIPSVLTLPSVAAQDGTIVESAENSNTGWQMVSNWPSIKVGDDEANRQLRAILSFQTNKLPPGAVITSVTLKVKKALLVGSNPFLSLGNIVVDIRKGAFGTSAALQIIDFQAPASRAAAIMIRNNPVAGWYQGALALTSFGFVNRSGVTQFRLRFAKDDNNNHIADYLRFWSGDYSAAASRPMLVIQYYVP